MSYGWPNSPEERSLHLQHLEDQYRFFARRLDTDDRETARDGIRTILTQLRSMGMEHRVGNALVNRETEKLHMRQQYPQLYRRTPALSNKGKIINLAERKPR